MFFCKRWLKTRMNDRRRPGASTVLSRIEDLEERVVLSASPLPVLLVIADQQDFYYQEYGDTRQALEQQGVAVQVAATTTQVSYPHAGTGEPAGTNGAVQPDIALGEVDASDYSAIAFVGGWGASSYQYAFEGTYANNAYNGDLATKAVVNNLINEFIAQDKHVAAICHGVTVLAWARVDGASPLNGKQVSVPFIGSPAVVYQGVEYGNYGLGQYEQVAGNGAIPNLVSGQYGNPLTVADDVIVDGRIITAENYDSAFQFGLTIAQEVVTAAQDEEPPTPNQPPVVYTTTWEIAENSPNGTLVGTVQASDPDAGQSLSYTLVGDGVTHPFTIDPASGQITVANGAALDFETLAQYVLEVQVTDNGEIPLTTAGLVIVRLTDVAESVTSGVEVVGNDLVVQGTDNGDVVYLWSSQVANRVYVALNGTTFGPYMIGPGGHVRVFSGGGNDQVFATDLWTSAAIFGEAGHDLITGGHADDQIDGGDGVDRIYAGDGDDFVWGGADQDFLFGGQGNDLILGGDGNDQLDGEQGRDILIGGLGRDSVNGGAGEDLLVGGTTTYDNDPRSLNQIRSIWNGPGSSSQRSAILVDHPVVPLAWSNQLMSDTSADVFNGGEGADLVFLAGADEAFLRRDDIRVKGRRR